VVIRAARESELPLISALEKSGDQLFRAAGMDRIADAPAPEPDAYRPDYARLGWSTLHAADLPPELAAARQHERDLGLDEWPRRAMAKNL
jgi:hypothetical protein